jgi:hypothetical protein
MPTKAPVKRVKCMNPNTGNSLQIDKEIYDLFLKAIRHTLKKGTSLTYTQIVDGVHDYFKQQNIKFDGSVSWYAITVKNDMEARGVIESVMEKGKKLNRLNK